MRILYLDCFSGISGDMTLAALVDAGADKTYIEQELRKITLEPYELHWHRVTKKGISAMKADVLLKPDVQPDHRHYSQIKELIQQIDFHPKVKQISLAVFDVIAKAEAKIHGVPVERVHFHEVGAIDSIIDVVGTALALHSLNIDHIIASPVPLGSGSVLCAHGVYPVPAPATLELMRGLPIADCSISKEMTTPTGAGIVAAIAQDFSASIPPMKIEQIGYGAGTRDLKEQPNVLRVIIGKREDQWAYPTMYNELMHEQSQKHEHKQHHKKH